MKVVFCIISVSSLTGEGIDDFLKLVQDCVKQYFEVYRPMYDQLLKEKVIYFLSGSLSILTILYL